MDLCRQGRNFQARRPQQRQQYCHGGQGQGCCMQCQEARCHLKTRCESGIWVVVVFDVEEREWSINARSFIFPGFQFQKQSKDFGDNPGTHRTGHKLFSVGSTYIGAWRGDFRDDTRFEPNFSVRVPCPVHV